MKSWVITFVLFSTGLSALGQKKADRLFQKALADYERGAFYEAASGFQEIAENHRQFKYYDQCLYNTTYSYHQADSYDLAITWYEKIRASNPQLELLPFATGVRTTRDLSNDYLWLE